MATEQSFLYDVYEGVWTNHARGHVNGATLTLGRQTGGVFIAFLALFVGLAGQGCWRIVRFYVHRLFSSTAKPDGIYNQRQAILRNSDTSLAAAIAFTQTNIAWRRKHVTDAQRRLLPVTSLSLSLSLVFAAAGILSSRVTSNDMSEVLLSGSHCGARQAARNWNSNDYDYDPDQMLYHGRKLTEYLAYALQCYRSTDTVISQRCQSYVKLSLSYTKTTNTSCPFSPELCVNHSQSVILDTGYLASDTDLGINANPSFALRQVRHCAPMKTEGFTKVHAGSNVTTDQTSLRYYFYIRPNDTFYEPTVDPELFTWQVPIRSNNSWLQYSYNAEQQSPAAYRLGVVSDSPLSSSSEILMPSKGNANAKVSILFLDASDIIYLYPSTDPWFATQPFPGSNRIDALYIAAQPTSVIACTTRVSICRSTSPSSDDCANIYNHKGLSSALTTIWKDTDQVAAIEGAVWYLNRGHIFESDVFCQKPGLPALLSQWSVDVNLQTDNITSDGWQIEMEYVFQASLASLQGATVELASGNMQWEYLPEGAQQSVCTPSNPNSACRTVCQNQKVKSPRHYSFSIVGISIILCFGGLLIVIGYWIETITRTSETWWNALLRRNRRHNPLGNTSAQTYARAEWMATATLQLQRLAHEALGKTTWSKTSEAVPVTERGEDLGILDIQDPHHPVLRQVTPESRDEWTEQPQKGTTHVFDQAVADPSGEASDQISFLTRDEGSDHASFDSDQTRGHRQEGYALRRLPSANLQDSIRFSS